MTRPFRPPPLALLLVALVTVASAGQAAAQSDGEDVIARLRQTYDGLDALSARFTQEAGGATAEGTLALRGDAYRIDTADQLLVSDGTTAWALSKSDRQVLVNDAVEDPSGFTPSTFFTRYPDRFDVVVTGRETLRGAPHDVLRLTPKDAGGAVSEVTLWARAADALPMRVRVTDVNGTAYTFALWDVRVNPPVTAGTFRYEPEPGVEVVDLRL